MKEIVKDITSIALGTALVFALLPQNHKKAKMHMYLVWLIYALIYKDCNVIVICILLLIFNFCDS
jgi:hypothetical protein